MNNPQYNTQETFQITEHWEIWEAQVNKLKSYLSELANNEYTFLAKNRKEEVWQEKTSKKLK